MKSHQDINRRQFLKTSAMTFAAAGLSSSIFSTPFKFLYIDSLDPSDEFSLLKLRAFLPEYEFPVNTDFETSNYQLNYSLHNVYPQEYHKTAGSFLMKKSKLNNKLSDYRISIQRLANTDMTSKSGDFYYFLKAKVISDNDLYSSPLSWECETKIALSEDDQSYMKTGHQWKGKRKKTKISLYSSHNNLTRIIPSENLTWKWGIIDMVQKMAKESIPRADFSTLDEMDMIYANQIIRFKRNKAIDCGKKVITFKVFDLTGDGIIPTVYWVDDHNRVCFIISGMEAYMIEG